MDMSNWKMLKRKRRKKKKRKNNMRLLSSRVMYKAKKKISKRRTLINFRKIYWKRCKRNHKMSNKNIRKDRNTTLVKYLFTK